MAGKYRTPKRAKKIKLGPDAYLTCRQGQWWSHQRICGASWIKLRISPQAARRLMDASSIERGEEVRRG